MEMMMNAVDRVFAIAEVVETIAQFFQREDVKRSMVKGRQIAQAVWLVVALTATVAFWFVLCGVKAIYRAWAVALPVAIIAFQEGYTGIQAKEEAAPKVLAAAVEIVVAVELSAKPLSQQLRQQCKEVGIQWRNANGRNKHMTVQQMQAALVGGECSSKDFANV